MPLSKSTDVSSIKSELSCLQNLKKKSFREVHGSQVNAEYDQKKKPSTVLQMYEMRVKGIQKKGLTLSNCGNEQSLGEERSKKCALRVHFNNSDPFLEY